MVQWVDEDEQEGAPEDDFAGYGGMPGGGMPGGGMGGLDFSKLSGMGGMGGMGGMPDLGELGADMEGMGGDDENVRASNLTVMHKTP